MKILTVSDRVEKFLYDKNEISRFQDVELILSCGDLQPEYLEHLTHSLNAPLFYVRGNHDLRHESKPPGGCLDINERLVRFKNLKILGIEGCRWYNGGPFQYTERQMFFKVWGMRPKIFLRGGVDIVISHAPPRHIHDAEDQCHRGFRIFHLLLNKHRPRYFIHGHIHENFSNDQERMSDVNDTRVINAYGHYLFEVENE